MSKGLGTASIATGNWSSLGGDVLMTWALGTGELSPASCTVVTFSTCVTQPACGVGGAVQWYRRRRRRWDRRRGREQLRRWQVVG